MVALRSGVVGWAATFEDRPGNYARRNGAREGPAWTSRPSGTRSLRDRGTRPRRDRPPRSLPMSLILEMGGFPDLDRFPARVRAPLFPAPPGDGELQARVLALWRLRRPAQPDVMTPAGD